MSDTGYKAIFGRRGTSNHFCRRLDKALETCPILNFHLRLETTKKVIDCFVKDGGQFAIWDKKLKKEKPLSVEEVKDKDFLNELIAKSNHRRSSRERAKRLGKAKTPLLLLDDESFLSVEQVQRAWNEIATKSNRRDDDNDNNSQQRQQQQRHYHIRRTASTTTRNDVKTNTTNHQPQQPTPTQCTRRPAKPEPKASAMDKASTATPALKLDPAATNKNDATSTTMRNEAMAKNDDSSSSSSSSAKAKVVDATKQQQQQQSLLSALDRGQLEQIIQDSIRWQQPVTCEIVQAAAAAAAKKSNKVDKNVMWI